MNELDINRLLDREKIELQMKNTLLDFEKNKNNLLITRGFYVYGDPGCGKTTFVTNILKSLDYDIVKYDAGDIRNKGIIESITKHNMSDKNIMSLFNKKVKKIAIIMDEIDGMNNGDKGGINTLIKLIRPKKTKKQLLEEITMNPIICIGNYHVDKKIKELMKVCNVVELKTPNNLQIKNIINNLFPSSFNGDDKELNKIMSYIQGDLRKINVVCDIYLNDNNFDFLTNNLLNNVFENKSYNDDTKKITNKLLTTNYKLEEHSNIMNETDRTIVGLYWHENIIDVLDKYDKNISVPFYLKQLDNICFADYIDRITFQKQIWQFNEMSSLIKTFKNHKLYHEFNKKNKIPLKDIRFTKVLTKYSTEYMNQLFIQNLCQQLSIDKKDLYSFFYEIKNKYDENEIVNLFENYEISKLDINRIFKYIEKYTKENAVGVSANDNKLLINKFMSDDADICDDEYDNCLDYN